MLASTVQFSSYGRRPSQTGAYPDYSERFDRRRTPQTPAKGAREGSRRKTPVPSGPNSVPGRPTPRTPASTPTPQGSQQYYQRREARRPTSRCSTHELHPERVRLERGPGRSHQV